MEIESNEIDAERVAAMARGDRAALAMLYDRYSPMLLAVGQRILADRREAEDLLHDVFIEAWRHAAEYDTARGSVRAWLIIRLRSRALDRRKSAAVSRTSAVDVDQLLATIPSVDGDPSLGPDLARVRRALAALSDDQRAVLDLGYFEGLSSSEIAERLKTPIGTVKSRVAAALAKLRVGMGLPPRELP